MNLIKNAFSSLWMKRLRPYPELTSLVMNYDSRKKAPQILYLGDSVLERVSWSDKDKRTLDRMVAAHLPDGKRLLCISHSAYHLKVYFHFLQILKCTCQKPELVILPVNMRSFSPQWDWNLAWQFDEEIHILKNYIKTPEMEIPVLGTSVDSIPLTEAEKMREVKYPFTELRRFGEFHDLIKSTPSTEDEKRDRKKQIYIFHYLHALSSNHPKLQALSMIVNLLRELSIDLLVYITPINYQGGIRFVGDEFCKTLRENTRVLRDLMSQFIEQETVRFLDLSETLSSQYFFHADEATEHLNQDGRTQLAKIIAGEIVLMDAKRNGAPSL